MYGKSLFLMGKSTINHNFPSVSMGMFTRGYHEANWFFLLNSTNLASMKSQLKMLKIPIKTLVKRSKIHDYCWFILPLSSRTTGKIIPRSFIRVLVRSPMNYAS